MAGKANLRTGAKQDGKFQKGKSGNPGGRPKKTPELIEVENLCKNLSIEAVERLAYWMREGEGSVSLKAAQALIDRGFGKPVETKNTTVTERRFVVEAPAIAADSETWERQYGRPN